MLKERWTRSLALSDTAGLAGDAFQAGGNRITGLADPTGDTDAATKGWVSILLAQYSAGIAGRHHARRRHGRAVEREQAAGPRHRECGADRRLRAHVELHEQPLGAEGLLERDLAPRDAQRVDRHQHLRRRTTFKDTVTLSGAGKSLVFGSTSPAHQGPLLRTPYSSRTIFTPDVANKNCQIGVLPTLAGGEGAWDIFGGTDPDNAPVLHLACNSTNATLQSTHTGGGATQAFTFYMDATLAYRIGTNGRMQMNGAADNGAQLNVNGERLAPGGHLPRAPQRHAALGRERRLHQGHDDDRGLRPGRLVRPRRTRSTCRRSRGNTPSISGSAWTPAAVTSGKRLAPCSTRTAPRTAWATTRTPRRPTR
jgi:hypothetical protein